MVNGDLSRHFGAADGNRESDVFHRAVLDVPTVKTFNSRQSVNSHRFPPATWRATTGIFATIASPCPENASRPRGCDRSPATT